jgi:mannose-6-phosphate isomerase-like protein (cupin superfamily)
MARLAHEENEANVLAFTREKLFDGVHMARVALRQGESSLFHRHTRTRDVFFVMKGRLTITIRLPTPERLAAYQSLSSTLYRIDRAHGGEFLHTLLVLPGEVVAIEPGTVHCAANMDEAPCHFVCVEGVGDYDFVEA